jgi:hypothetical protein
MYYFWMFLVETLPEKSKLWRQNSKWRQKSKKILILVPNAQFSMNFKKNSAFCSFQRLPFSKTYIGKN